MATKNPFDTKPYELAIDGLESKELRLVKLNGQEMLSRLFEFALTVYAKDSNLNPDDIVGKSATITIFTPEGEVARYISGIIADFQQDQTGFEETRYSLQLAPRLKLLEYKQDCRILQNLTLKALLGKILQEFGFSASHYRITIENDKPRDYCVQYRETTLNFIERLMQEEGVVYFFEHSKGSHTLVISNNPQSWLPLKKRPSLFYHQNQAALPQGEFVTRMRYSKGLTTNAVMMRDFDFKKPSVDHLQSQQKLPRTISAAPVLEHYDYPGLYEKTDKAKARVSAKLLSLQQQRERITALTNCRAVSAGAHFSLTTHPVAQRNQDLLITSIQIRGQNSQYAGQGNKTEPQFTCSFTAVPLNSPYLPAHAALRPTIDSVQTAIVVGPSGEEIYTDEYGRVKVQFHWDREGEYNEKSSCWVRVSQVWAGASWGAMHIPRIGQEVIVSFEEGNPDRPLITGRTYNSENQPPFDLPSNKTLSGIKSNSAIGGNGSNELVFDDTKDGELLTLHAERNQSIEVENDEKHWVGNDRVKNVDHNELVIVGQDREEHVGQTETINIGRNQVLAIKQDQQQEVGETRSTEVGKDDLLRVGKNLSMTAGDKIVIKTGEASITLNSNGDIVIQGTNLSFLGSGDITIKADQKVTIKGSKILQN